MEQFEISYHSGDVIIKKEDQSFSIEKSPDGDIWFNTTNNNLDLLIRYSPRNQHEWKTYAIFLKLMRCIVGRFMLSGDYHDEYSPLPKDFIDLKNKTITWHSDTDSDNTLRISLADEGISISIFNTKLEDNKTIKVRIRTSGSSYEYYYQQFEDFFNELSRYAYQNDSSNTVSPQPKQKKLPSLFDKFKK